MGKPRNIRRIGMALSLALSLAGAGVVAYFVIKGKGATPGKDTTGVGDPAGAPPTAPDSGDSDIVVVGIRDKALVQFVDRNDPTRKAGELRWKSLDPLAGGRANIVEPRGVLFFKDGGVLKIEAARGSMYRPPRTDEPESGTFEGRVTIAFYDAPTQQGRAVDVEKDAASLTIVTDTLRFDRALYEVATSERWSLTSERLSASGRGLRLVGNDVNGRLELGELDQCDGVTIKRGGPSKPRANAAKPAPATPDSPRPDQAPPTEQGKNTTLYAIQVNDGVSINAGSRSIKGGIAEVWVRLVNNQLPDGALGPNATGSAATTPAATSAAPPTPTVTGQAAGTPKALGEDDVIRLTWKGKLTIRPVDVPTGIAVGQMSTFTAAAVNALAKNDVAVRIGSGAARRTGTTPTKIEFGDASRQIRGEATSLFFGATTRDLTLSGSKESPIIVRAGQRRFLQTMNATMNLGTGIGQTRGETVLSEIISGEPESFGAKRRAISWSDQGDIELATRDGWATDLVLRAAASGSVLARDEKVEVHADFMEALMTTRSIQAAASATDPATSRVVGRTGERDVSELQRIKAEGNVHVSRKDADQTKAGQLTAHSAIVSFVPTEKTGEPRVSHVHAEGNVCGIRGPWQVLTQRLDAEIDQNAAGEMIVKSADGEGSVRFIGPKGLSVESPRFALDALKETIDLAGDGPESVTITQRGATVFARQARAEYTQGQGGVEVIGPGRLSFASAADGMTPRVDAESKSDFTATWTQSLSYAEAQNAARIAGDVQAAWANGSSRRVDRLWADTVNIEFTQTEEPTGVVTPEGEQEKRKRVVRAVASGLGDVFDAADSSRLARVESVSVLQQAAGDANGREARRMIYLEGQSIEVSETQNTLTVPGPGRLLVDERGGRSQPIGAAGGETPRRSAFIPTDAGALSGSSLFSWSNGLSLSRANGDAAIRGGVRLIHRPENKGGVMTLDCAELLAKLRFSDGTGGGAIGGDADFLSATARGGVQAQGEDQRKVLAEIIHYDAKPRILTAGGDDLTRATLIDPARPAPVAARKIIWNLVTDRIEVSDPAPVSPR